MVRTINRLVLVALVFPALTALTGCSDESTTAPEDSAVEQVGPPVQPDDRDAVAALEAAGCRLTKNENGVVTEIAVSSDSPFTDVMPSLAGVPNITVARFGGPGMTDEAMVHLKQLEQLKRLDLTDCPKIGDATLDVVAGIPTLDVLILRRTGITDDGLQAVTALPKLRAIDLRNTNISDAGVAHLSGMTSLIDVQLEKSKVTDDGVSALVELPLKSLNLNYTAVTDEAMPAIGRITTLEQLQLDAARLTDVGMAHVGKLKKLRRFSCRLADVTGEGIQHLSDLTDLTRLELRETSADDAALEIISQLPKLEFLDISECRLVNGEGISKLGALTTLTYLELREIKEVRDESFAPLEALTNLRDLNLEATRVTTESVPVILKMTKLERLNIAGSQIDDAGMVMLGQLPALKTLNLTNCYPTDDTLAELQAAKPDLAIAH